MTEDNQTDPVTRNPSPTTDAGEPVETEDTKRARRAAQRENFFVSLIINVIAPTLIMTQLNDPDRLGPRWALVVGLAFPIGYSVWYFIKSRSFSMIAFFGLLAVLLTGGLELAGVKPIWFAVKEAAIPLLIGLATLISLKTKNPLVNTLLLNPQIIDRERIDKRLAELGNEHKFHAMLVRGTWWVAASFLVSAILNFGLAYVIIKSPAGTPERTQELGLMQGWSWVVITIPVTIMLMYALWQILSGLQKLTGLELDDLFHPEARGEKPAEADS
jgi:hypothetical protein